MALYTVTYESFAEAHGADVEEVALSNQEARHHLSDLVDEGLIDPRVKNMCHCSIEFFEDVLDDEAPRRVRLLVTLEVEAETEEQAERPQATTLNDIISSLADIRFRRKTGWEAIECDSPGDVSVRDRVMV